MNVVHIIQEDQNDSRKSRSYETFKNRKSYEVLHVSRKAKASCMHAPSFCATRLRFKSPLSPARGNDDISLIALVILRGT